MLYGGFATGAFGLVSKTEIFTSLEQNFLISLHERAFMTLGVATASIIGGHLLVIANQVCYAHFGNPITFSNRPLISHFRTRLQL